MGADVGYEGAYMPLIVGEGTLNECRNLAGPPPVMGKKWVMINLDTGEFKWYTSRRRRYGGGRRRYPYRGYGRRY